MGSDLATTKLGVAIGLTDSYKTSCAGNAPGWKCGFQLWRRGAVHDEAALAARSIRVQASGV